MIIIKPKKCRCFLRNMIDQTCFFNLTHVFYRMRGMNDEWSILDLTWTYKRDIALHHSESFHHSLLPFLFDWWTKRWEITKEVSMKHITLMTKIMCTWLHHPLKLLLSIMFCCLYQFKSARMVSCWDLYVYSWAVSSQYSCY